MWHTLLLVLSEPPWERAAEWFTNSNRPATKGNPYFVVTGDAAGNLYGTAYRNGPNTNGIVDMLDPTGHEAILLGFKPRRNIYGTTPQGGTKDSGVVFEITAATSEWQGLR